MNTNAQLIAPGVTRSDGNVPRQPFVIQVVGNIGIALMSFAVVTSICLVIAHAIVGKPQTECGEHTDLYIEAYNTCKPFPDSEMPKIPTFEKAMGTIHEMIAPLWVAPILAMIAGGIGLIVKKHSTGSLAMGSACCNLFLWPTAGYLGALSFIIVGVGKLKCAEVGYTGPKSLSEPTCYAEFSEMFHMIQTFAPAMCPMLEGTEIKQFTEDELFCSSEATVFDDRGHCWCQCRQETLRVCSQIPSAVTVAALTVFVIAFVSVFHMCFGCAAFCAKDARADVEEYQKKQQLIAMSAAQAAQAKSRQPN